MDSFVEKNKDFVLKLKIQTAERTQIRRVPLPRVVDSCGNLSILELNGLVLQFTLPEDATDASIENYDVTLTYYDDEKDLITLASTPELIEAVELFAGQKFIRITTSVKPKKASSSPASTQYVPNTQGTNTNNVNQPSNPPIHDVLESFAGILSSAVSNLQEGLAKQPSTSPMAKASPPPKPSPSFKPMETAARRANRVAMREKRRERMEARINNKKKTPIPVKKESKPKPPETSPPVDSSDKKESEAKPFIHGRHTCDGCLTTPIIGKRYHATNLPDYDLCEKCFSNYKGSEIKYEPVELRHDIPLQNHWRLRQERKANLMNLRNRSARRGISSYPCAPPRFGGPNVFSRPATNTSPSFATNTGTTTFNSNNFDDSLKEAIRRSLDDVAPKEDATKKGKNDEKTQEDEPRKIEDTMKPEPSKDKISVEKEVAVDDKVSEKDTTDAEDDIPRSVDIPENTAQIERLTSSDSVTEKTSVSLEVEDEEALQNAMDTESVDSEKLVSESPSNDSPASKPKSMSSPRNESFASDAVGNGDAAEVIGKTLDMVAGVIDEMLESGEMISRVTEESTEFVKLSEALEKTASDIEKLAESMEETKEDVKVLANENEDGENLAEDGDIIVDSNEAESEANIEEDDETDWSVVKSIGSNGTTESQKIGRAAEMLGSALFNSDMRSSAEVMGSNVDASDSFSVPSSVPTELGTVNTRLEGSNPAAKWATQLTKLKELGFENEEACIDALERVKSDLNKDDFDLDYVVNQLVFLNA